MAAQTSKFYLGRVYDPVQGKITDQSIDYEPSDLTTHGLVMGMTGSGKTGLCIGLLEEAALSGLPALMIDVKGDICNALLHFPDLSPQDFQPWIDPEAARKNGQTLEAAAAETAQRWKKGLADWSIGPERIKALQSAVQFTVYTPGLQAVNPINILSSFQVPSIPWAENRDILRERISSTVTALLGLLGFKDVDPVRSREHILLANIFEGAWSQNKSLNLTDLILQTQTPPFAKLGVFPVENMFPEKDRLDLAMQLNNLLAAPAFQAWMDGAPLDIESLLYTPDKKPRHTIFYIAHLPEEERMFFVTLLFSAIETWMRSQTGVSSLRALVYFDEIFGYLPPVANPPCKEVILRMLKQARAFGVGLLLATQNPVDADYKGLSNVGTWFIGKLQTERDKARLLDGLEGAAGGLNRSAYDKMISKLDKRVFLLHNVHQPKPLIFMSRMAMNYLAGPLTTVQIPVLNKMVGVPVAPKGERSGAKTDASVVVVAPPGTDPVHSSQSGTTMTGLPSRQTVPSGIDEYFLSAVSPAQAVKDAKQDTLESVAPTPEILYRPGLLAQAHIRYLDRRYGLDHEQRRSVLVTQPDRRGVIKWAEVPFPPLDANKIPRDPTPNALFATLDAPLSDAKMLKSLQTDFSDWVYRTGQITLRANETLKVYSGPAETMAAFKERCSEAARQQRDKEAAKAAEAIERKLATLKDKLVREERELAKDQSDYDHRKLEEFGTGIENVASLLGLGRKKSLSTSLTKRRLTENAKADVDESVQAIQAFKTQIAELEKEKAITVQAVNDRWGDVVNQVTEIPIAPAKKDIFVELFGVVWLPYYVYKSGDQVIEIPAYQQE